MIETAVRYLLINAATLTPTIADRVFFSLKPQNENRASVVVSRVATTRELVFKGPAGYSSGTLQLDCFAPDYPTAKQLAEAVRKVLHGFSGTVAEVDQVGYLGVSNDRDMPATPAEGRSNPSVFGVSLDVDYSTKE